MTKKLLMLIGVCFLANYCFAQQRTIKGTIKDATTGETLIGASVSLPGSTVGTLSDTNGKFSISISDSIKNLTVKYIGYTTQNINIVGKQELEIKLQSSVNALNEIVVLGYGTTTKGDLTGSVSTLNAEQIKDVPIISAEQALTGRLAGVQVTGAEGSPDAEVKIIIRGGTSVNQDNAPLYIIDGVQVEDGLASISPQDIENISILKDASATAIYGARGSNGVVLITTKSGKAGKTRISYNGSYGLGKLANKLDVMSPYDFVQYQYERSRINDGEKSIFDRTYGRTYDTLNVYKDYNPIDWQQEVLGNTANNLTQNVSLSGGNKKIRYNASYTFNDQDGTVVNTSYKKHLFNVKTDLTSIKNLKIGTSFRFTHTEPRGIGTSDPGNASYNRLRAVVKYRPLQTSSIPIDEFDEDYFEETNAGSGLGFVNPFIADKAEYRNTKSDNFNISTYGDYKINKYLSARVSGGFSLNTSNGYSYYDTLSYTSRSRGGGKIMAAVRGRDNQTFNQSNVLTYSNKTKKRDFSILAGQEIYISRTNGNFEFARDLPSGTPIDQAFDNIDSYNDVIGYPIKDYNKSTILSFFSRANYSYKSRYLFTLTVRADGSSKFAQGNRWGYFPSAAFAWRVSNEKFMIPFSETISDLKFRVSYGVVGNNRIGDYKYQNSYKTTRVYPLNDITTNLGYEADYLANENLTWESTTSKNLGLDIGLFDNKLQLTIDAYHNKTDDVLIFAPIPNIYGYGGQLQNIASTLNKGIEGQLRATIFNLKKFKWTSDFNISFNRNEVLRINKDQNFYLENSGWGISGQSDYIVQVGHPVGSMFGYQVDGFYKVEDFDYDPATTRLTLKGNVVNNTKVVPQPGSIKFKDLDGDNIITDADRGIIGNATPKFYGGFNQQFNIKNFDLSFFVNFQYGNDVLNANKLEFTNAYAFNTNLLAIDNGRWKTIDENGNLLQFYSTVSKVITSSDPQKLAQMNQGASIWAPLTGTDGYLPTSFAIENGSFLRFNNFTVGYTFDNKSKFLTKAHINRFRVYGTLNNIAIITNYSGYDPEVNTRRSTPVTPGVDYSAYPRNKSFYFGLNLTL